MIRRYQQARPDSGRPVFHDKYPANPRIQYPANPRIQDMMGYRRLTKFKLNMYESCWNEFRFLALSSSKRTKHQPPLNLAGACFYAVTTPNTQKKKRRKFVRLSTRTRAFGLRDVGLPTKARPRSPSCRKKEGECVRIRRKQSRTRGTGTRKQLKQGMAWAL